ncbi:MAG TPA: hypothetical protein VE291_11650 [Terracidiphilus sp.]|jgi:hypothetical protein|nr:hypothetical protein [Terracidiphilus sp.]
MMRRFVVIGVMLVCLCSIHGQKTRLGQTPPTLATVHLHISASHLRLNCSGSSIGSAGPGVECGYGLYVDAILNGKKIELWGDSKIGKQRWALVAPGDYTAQLTSDEHNADQSVVSQNYRLLLPDGTTWSCQLSGIME